MHNSFLMFLLCSYAVGWAGVALRAKFTGMVDLCQFVQTFIIAPFALTLVGAGVFALLTLLWKCIIPNIIPSLIVVAFIATTVGIMFLSGRYVVVPAVKKAYGVAKPFSEKICIVLYDKRRAK